MASYQNTSEYYCGTTMDSYPEHCTYPSVYFEQNRPNFQVHDAVYSRKTYGSVYNNGHYYESPAPQYHLNQYTPLTTEPVFHQEPRLHQNNNYMDKRHHAQITIVPSSTGNYEAVIKRKRKRTMFTTEQVEALEKIFKKQQYVSREERQLIVKNLKISDKAVKLWFQNRRLKIKRMEYLDSDEQEACTNEKHSEEANSSPDITRLNSVESEITKKTDEYGFVTLDERVMGELANVIEDVFKKSSEQIPVKDIVGNDSPIYEPISPASVCDGNEENSLCWRPTEPNESLEILFDLQSMLLL